MSQAESGSFDRHTEIGPNFVSIESFAEAHGLDPRAVAYVAASLGIPIMHDPEAVVGLEDYINKNASDINKGIEYRKKYIDAAVKRNREWRHANPEESRKRETERKRVYRANKRLEKQNEANQAMDSNS